LFLYGMVVPRKAKGLVRIGDAGPSVFLKIAVMWTWRNILKQSTIRPWLNSTLVAGATATNFGRTHADRSVVYVTTSGEIGSPVKIEGGKIVAIST
jgi:hypothetical protein